MLNLFKYLFQGNGNLFRKKDGIMANSFRFLILRKKTSYQFKDDMKSADDWTGDHNAKHNMEDSVYLFMNEVIIFQSDRVQTVANMPGVRHTDTIIPCKFYIKWDVDRRAFKGNVHGIIGAQDQDGQFIDNDSVESIVGKDGSPIDWARWIFFHSTRRNDPAPAEPLTRFAWSAGCCIGTPEKQDELYSVGQEKGIFKGQLIPCELKEV
jgi:hypothetical protein